MKLSEDNFPEMQIKTGMSNWGKDGVYIEGVGNGDAGGIQRD